MTGPPCIDHMYTQFRIASELSDCNYRLSRSVGVQATLFHWYSVLEGIYKLQDSNLLGCEVHVLRRESTILKNTSVSNSTVPFKKTRNIQYSNPNAFKKGDRLDRN